MNRHHHRARVYALCAFFVFVSACAAPESSEYKDMEEQDESTDSIEQSFTESTCRTVGADVTESTWDSSLWCLPGKFRRNSSLTSPTSTYDHGTCTDAFVADFTAAPTARRVSVFDGETSLPANKIQCENLTVSARAWAINSSPIYEYLGMQTATGVWTPTGSFSGTCSLSSNIDFYRDDEVLGLTVNKMRVVAQSYISDLSGPSYRKVRVTAQSDCVP